MSCGSVAFKPDVADALTMSGVTDLIGRFKKIEGWHAGVGPELSVGQINRMIGEAKAAEGHWKQLQDLTESDRKEWATLTEELRVHRMGCEYRLHGPQDSARVLSEKETESLGHLRGRVREIKREGKLYVGAKNNAELTQQEKDQLELVAKKYPEYVPFLLNCSKKRLELFIKFALRSNCSVDVFVQFQVERELLTKVLLDQRMGRSFGPAGIIVENGQIKLLIDGAYESVHDKKKEVRLSNLVDDGRDDLVMSMEALYEEFEAKTHQYGRVDVFGIDKEGRRLGVVNWDAIRQGSYDPETEDVTRIDSTRWDELPGFILTRAEIQDRFPDQTLCEGKEWGVAFCSNRFSPDLSVSKAHSYLVVYIPMTDGRYKVLPMGLQPSYGFPETMCGKIMAIGATHFAEIHFPDESYFLSDRELMGIFCALDKTERQMLKEMITYEIDKGRKGQKVFQAQGNNCANFVYKIFYKIYVRRHLLDPLVEMLGETEGAKTLVKNLERAAKCCDDDGLEETAQEIVDHLDRGDLERVVTGCRALLQDTLFKDDKGELAELSLKELAYADEKVLRAKAKELMVETLKSLQIFRGHILDAAVRQWFFNFIMKVFNFFIKIGLLTRKVATFLLWLFQVIVMGAWRFRIVTTEKGRRFKCVAANKYLRSGYQALPSSLWVWKERGPEFKARLNRSIQKINSMSSQESEAAASALKLGKLFPWRLFSIPHEEGATREHGVPGKGLENPLSTLMGSIPQMVQAEA